MKIKQQYTFTNSRTIWRLLPTENGKLIIEERNIEKKEAFFNCVDIRSGGKIFTDLQLDEKFWVGIESIYNDIIFFHKFTKPDMPIHKGIFAFDILSQKIIWKNEELTFLFNIEANIYAYTQKFEGKNYYKLDALAGEILEDLGNNFEAINRLHDQQNNSNNHSDSYFPEPFASEKNDNENVYKIIADLKENKVISGRIEYVLYKDNMLALSFHEPTKNGALENNFAAVEIDTQKIIFEERLNKSTNMFISDSFFIKDNLLFLLIEKMKLKVCSIK